MNMGKIDIVHVIDNMGIGGAQSMMFELYHALHKHYSDYCNQFVISSENRSSDDVFVSTSKVECVKLQNASFIAGRIASLHKPIAIYHKLASSLVDIPKYIKAKGVPVIAVNHTLYNSRQWNKADARCCDVLVAVSKHMMELTKKWYPKIKQYTYIHNATNKFRYDPIVPEKREKGKLITGRSNRICGWKHSEQWMTWIKDVHLPLKMVHDYLGGRVTARSYNSTKVSPKFIKGRRNVIRMLGNISDFDTKVSIMKGWDLFLYETNREEGISMAILEALACGVPVVCSDHYGNKEIIENGVNGYIFKDKREATSILSHLCNNPQELEELKRKTSEHFVKHLDAKYAAEKYVQLINGVFSGKIGNSISEISSSVQIKSEDQIKFEGEKKVDNKFTILTSCYNKVKYLEEWANSILIQSYRPLEVVIANDCSTDGSGDMLRSLIPRFQEKKIEFKIITNFDRLYCGSSYRNLVQYATGSYFGVLDADDMLVNDAVEYIMKMYNKYPDIAWIYTQFEICDMQMKYKRKGFCTYPPSGQSLLDLGNQRIHGYGHWRTFNYKVKKPAKLFGKSLQCSVDKHMGYRLEETAPGMFIDRVCYRYRQHPIGSTDSVSSTKYAIEMWDKVKEDALRRRKKNMGQRYYPIIKGE